MIYLSDLVCVNGKVCVKGSEKPFTGFIEDGVGFPYTEIWFRAEFENGRIKKNYIFQFENSILDLNTRAHSYKREDKFFVKNNDVELSATGIVHIIGKGFWTTGPCVSGIKEGIWISRDRATKEVIEEHHYLHGKLVGEQWTYNDGDMEKSNYHDGVLHGEYLRTMGGVSPYAVFEENGWYDQGVKVGKWYIQDRISDIEQYEETQYWMDGKMVGSEKSYFPPPLDIESESTY